MLFSSLKENKNKAKKLTAIMDEIFKSTQRMPVYYLL